MAKYYFIDNVEFTNTFGNSINILDKQTFNIDHFRVSLNNSINNYFVNVVADIDLQRNFKIRFEYANILDDGLIGTVRNLEGKMINKYEDLDSLPGLDIKIGIRDSVPTKK